MDCTPALSTRDAWLGHCVADIGRPGFHARLLQGIHSVLGADHFSHLSYDHRGRIRHAAAASVCDQRLIDSTTDIYVNHLYQRDPNYPLVRDNAPEASGQAPDLRLLRMSPTSIGDTEYRRVLFDEPGFTGKVSLLGQWDDRSCYLNFYFSRVPLDMGRASTLLGQYGSTLMGLACRHDELAFPGDEEEAAAGRDAWSALSPRERSTAQLLMDGCTAKEIGRTMALSPATIVTYKERIFAKLGVGSLREFLALGRPPERRPASMGPQQLS